MIKNILTSAALLKKDETYGKVQFKNNPTKQESKEVISVIKQVRKTILGNNSEPLLSTKVQLKEK